MEALKEAIKEFGRVIVLSIIPILISSLLENTFDWKVLAITAAIAGLRFIDKWLHEYNKALPVREQNKGLLGEDGLVGF